MCGRYTQTKSREETIQALAGIELPPLFLGRYNVAPSQTVAVIRQQSPDRAEECLWGFEAQPLLINARAETLAERPTFKGLLADHRCLVPADGFYEWKGKQPYYFHLPGRELFVFAGLWRNGRCVVVTRAADAGMRGIHDRMPAILRIAERNEWLGGARLPDAPALSSYPVSRRVNSVVNDDPACLARADEQADLSLFPGME